MAAASQALLGIPELALYFTPLFLIIGLLLCGRFVGEARILARRVAAIGARRRRPPRRVRRPAPSRPIVSLLARAVHVERGPPAALAPAA